MKTRKEKRSQDWRGGWRAGGAPKRGALCEQTFLAVLLSETQHVRPSPVGLHPGIAVSVLHGTNGLKKINAVNQVKGRTCLFALARLFYVASHSPKHKQTHTHTHTHTHAHTHTHTHTHTNRREKRERSSSTAGCSGTTRACMQIDLEPCRGSRRMQAEPVDCQPALANAREGVCAHLFVFRWGSMEEVRYVVRTIFPAALCSARQGRRD